MLFIVWNEELNWIGFAYAALLLNGLTRRLQTNREKNYFEQLYVGLVVFSSLGRFSKSAFPDVKFCAKFERKSITLI